MADRKRILVADDDPDLLELLRMDMSMQGYEVKTAANGKDALQLAMTEKFDLLMLDVMMPYIDGYHVAYEVTSKLGAASPRIIIITSRDTVREKGIALMSGAHEMIQKPFELDKVNAKVAEIFGIKPAA
jgi:DNA-binding response OmpR family regulator